MGTWAFYQMLEEGPVMILGGLAVFDSSKNEVEEPAYCDGAAMTVTPGPGESTITYTVPAAWLSDPARVFPVSIDPTIYPAAAAADTCTSDSYPTTSYGTQVDLNVGYRGSVTGHQRAYLKFTLPSDLTGAYVQTAFLQLHESAQYLNSPQVCRVAMMSKDWTESSTYNSIGAPSTYELLHANECPTTGSSPQDLSFSFPEAAQAYADGSTNFGFCIYSDATDTNDYRKIDSRECPTPENRPTFEITYLPAIRMQTTNPTGDYYVHGDGAQDDTDAIQAAIDDTDAGVVVLPAGTFKTTGLHIGRSDFVLRGAGTSTQLTVASASQDHVLLIGAPSAISNVTVKDLYVRMPASGDGIRLEGSGGGSHITLTALSLGGGADSSTTHAISVGSGFDDLTILGNDLTGVTALPFDVSSSVSRAGICTNGLAYDPYVPEFFGGEDRYDTSVRITSLSYPGGVPGGTVVLAPGDDNAYTSALCAVPLARAYSGPLLLTPSAGLDDAVKTELQHQNPDLIFLVGLSDALVTAVQHAMPSSTVTKLTGVDVNDTAAKVAGQIKTKVGTVTQVVIVPSDDFHDAVTVGAVAANNKWPILYTPKAGPIPQTTQTCYHTTLGATKALVVGVNTNVSVPYISSPVRVNGADGPDTAGLVADYAAGLSSNPSTYLYTGLATGEDWPDALLVGKYMGQWAGTVLLTSGSTIPSATQSRLNLHVYDLLGLKYINLPGLYAADQNPGLFVPGAPRHTPYDLGDFAGHAAQASLDQGRLEVTTTDLEIASFGPRAALDRTYWSTRTAAGYIAPGWRFSFERSLNVSLAASGRIDYLDEAGETFTFIKNSALWLSPPGMAGTLRPDGSNWKLTPPGGNTLAFDSSGKLISEADDNGNTVTYTWTSGYLTRITAANAQQIQLTLNGSHQLTQAVYQTTNGTRTATYAAASPWTITYSFSGSPSTPSRSLTYGFTSSLLSAITATAFTGSTSATESFTYSGSPSKLSTVCFADYDASANPDARAEIAYAGASATITTYGRVYSTSAVSGADHTAVAQTFTWNPSGTTASKTNPKTASEAAETWSYTYSPLGNYLLTETSPLNKTRTWTYNNRGNMTSEQDELGRTTTYTYPDLDADFGGYVTSQVSANADDAYDANTTLHATDYPYEAVGRGTAVDKAGFRFQNVSIPTGATITSAQLHLYAYYSATGNPALLNTKLGLEDQDNPGAWVTGTHEPRLATMTTAYVTWAPSSWAAGTWYDSPNIKDSVQEVVDRAGWASGHAMAVLWVDNGTAASNLCNPADSSSGASAVLTIYWTRNLDPDPTEDQPKTVTDPRGHTTEYSYDAQGNLTKVVRQLSATESAETDYTYADKTVGSATYHGALTQQKSLVSGTPASGVWATTDFAPADAAPNNIYYPNGRPKTIVSRGVALGNGQSPDLTASQTYNDFGNLLSNTDTAGQTAETNTYDLAGNRLTSTGPAFTATVGTATSTQVVGHHTYDPWGHETESWATSTGEAAQTKANWTTTTYDKAGRVSEQKHWLNSSPPPSGTPQSTQDLTYDGLGRLIQTADTTVSGLPALTAYDARGNAVASWLGGACTGTYDLSKAARHVNSDNTPAYDAVGQALKSAPPADDSTTLTYTDNGKVLRQTKADGTWTEYTYDEVGNVTHTKTSVSSPSYLTTAVYDYANRLTSSTDGNNLTTNYTYDLLGRQITAGAQGQSSSLYTYNTLGWQLSVQDADGFTTSRIFDSVGRLTQETTASYTSTFTYQSGGSGLMSQKDEADNHRTTLTYDWFGRPNHEVQTLTSPSATYKDTSLVYDSLGRVATSTDNTKNLTHSFTYPQNTAGSTTDAYGVGTSGSDLISTTLTIGADGLEASRASTITSSPQVPNVTRSITTRDSAKRVTKATLQTDASRYLYSQYLFDSAGRIQRQWGPDSGAGSGYLSTASSTNAYTYDATSGLKTADNLQLQSVVTAGAISSTYTYTPNGRLASSSTNGSPSESYGYDQAGNIQTAGSTSFTYNQNVLDTSLTGGATTYYFFDAAKKWRTVQAPTNSQTDLNRTAFAHTGTGRLASWTKYTSGTATTTATYTYDAQGQRTQSVVTQGGVTKTTNFVYEGLLLRSLSASQTDTSSWKITYLYDENGRPYAGVYRNPGTSTTPVVFGMVTTDRGDVVELLDASGNPFAAYRCDAWGNPQGAGNVGTGIWSQGTSLITSQAATDIANSQVLRYASYCYDSESGLYYLSARSYDPKTRQFLSKDLSRNDGEQSAYQYCAGNPVKYTDPTGFRIEDDGYRAAQIVAARRMAMAYASAWAPIRAKYQPIIDAAVRRHALSSGSLLGSKPPTFSGAIAAGSMSRGWSSASSHLVATTPGMTNNVDYTQWHDRQVDPFPPTEPIPHAAQYFGYHTVRGMAIVGAPVAGLAGGPIAAGVISMFFNSVADLIDEPGQTDHDVQWERNGFIAALDMTFAGFGGAAVKVAPPALKTWVEGALDTLGIPAIQSLEH